MFLQGIGLLAGAVALEGLSGAIKVCAEYGRGPSGKVRCQAWKQGRGRNWNPDSLKTIKSYEIPGVRKAAAQELGSKYMLRKYRYRKTLPYLPVEYIRAIEEEEIIPQEVPTLTVEEEDQDLFPDEEV